MPRIHLLVVVMALVLTAAHVSAPQDPASAQDTMDDRVYTIARGLMCPTCAGQTVAESNAPLAQQMRAEIRAALAQGRSAEDIRAFFVAQFGEAVLAEPPRRGIGWIVWIAPLTAVSLGAVAVIVFLRRAVRADLPTTT